MDEVSDHRFPLRFSILDTTDHSKKFSCIYLSTDVHFFPCLNVLFDGFNGFSEVCT